MVLPVGITSACAEQTSWCSCRSVRYRDHLRVCGADQSLVRQADGDAGSPPRVRSRPNPTRNTATFLGITSACAEQTRRQTRPSPRPRDHLRVCGADQDSRDADDATEGSPPRVRSRREQALTERDQTGITSACAEQTRWCSARRRRHRDHLRVCGADRSD